MKKYKEVWELCNEVFKITKKKVPVDNPVRVEIPRMFTRYSVWYFDSKEEAQAALNTLLAKRIKKDSKRLTLKNKGKNAPN